MCPRPVQRAPRRKARLADLLDRARAAGIRLSPARQVILSTLLDLDTHPTADEVYAAACVEDPGLGRATVFRALDALTEAGILTKALHAGAAVRYDIRAQPHHHLVCTRCETIIDILDDRLDRLVLPDTSNLGFHVANAQVQLRGICQSCRNKEKSS